MPTIEKIRDRFRYGLATQALFRRLRRIGLRISPYILYLEKPGGLPVHPGPYSIERITLEALQDIAAKLPDVSIDLAAWRRRIEAGNLGLLLKEGDNVVGYTWASLEYCRGIAVRPLFLLTDRQAYLFDLYVSNEHRGRGIASVMRERSYAELERVGRSELYSISEYFNTPVRQLKRRLAAQPLELRLGLTLFRRWRFDTRLRRYREQLPTRWGLFSNRPNPLHLT